MKSHKQLNNNFFRQKKLFNDSVLTHRVAFLKKIINYLIVTILISMEYLLTTEFSKIHVSHILLYEIKFYFILINFQYTPKILLNRI